MSDSRTKNSVRNISWGILDKSIGIIFPFLMRTLIIYILGVQYAGLNSLFSSILGVLSLAELGIGSALTFSMYAPAAKGDIKSLSALLNFYKKCYLVIGIVILGIGLLVIPFLDKFIKGDHPEDINIYLLYGIYLFNTVISYFMFAYKGALLTAYQRNDIRSNITTALQIGQYAIQIAVLLSLRDYYAYIMVTPVTSVATNLLTAYIVDKSYPEIRCAGVIDRETRADITQKVKGMVFQKIGGVVLSSVDNIVISAFLGLRILAIYNNYYMIITSLFGILNVIMNAIIPSVGNAVNTKTVIENYDDHRRFNFLYLWIVSWCSVCMLCLYQPFIRLWLHDGSLVLPDKIMMLFVCYFFVHKWMDINYVYQEAVGLWWENRYVPLLAACLNLVVNIILVQKIGIAGILISTIISVLLVYNTGYVFVLFKYYFKKSPYPYIIRQVYYVVCTIIAMGVTYLICDRSCSNTIASLITRGMVCLVIPNVMFLLSYHKLPEFRETLEFGKRIVQRRG